MTGRHDLDRELTGYLEARATSNVPDGLLEDVLWHIGATRQRPGWVIPDRWFPARTMVRLARMMRGSARLALAALLIAIVVAAIIVVGSQRRLPPPFGPARAGLIVSERAGHLFVMNADGSGPRQLTFGPNFDFRPTWSRDGTLIAYISSSSDGTEALTVVSADGQRHVTIADGLAPSDQGQISWAPDSRRLAFAAAAADPPLSLSHIYVAQADRSGVTELGGPGLAGFDPAWSPDGRRIAFKSLHPVDALWLMDADGSNAHRLTQMPGSGYAFWNAQWSPDGTHLLFLAGDDGAHDVWTINADGTDPRNISKSPEDESWPAWSPDGASIAFVRISPQGRGTFVVTNANGSETVLIGPQVDGNMPIWSPDGTKMFGSWLVNGVHQGVVVYDLLGRMAPITIADSDDEDWQRLAN